MKVYHLVSGTAGAIDAFAFDQSCSGEEDGRGARISRDVNE